MPATINTNDLSTPTPRSSNVDLKLIEANNDGSTMIIERVDKLIDKNQYKSNQKLTKMNSENNGQRRTDRSTSSNRRAFPLYPDCMSDWDSTDSEAGLNENNPNDENETCQNRS